MADVNLSKAVRSNLLSLQSTAAAMAKTQNRLATGLRVNSALDNPSNFFTASALNSRAGDMANLLDSMSSGIKTIEAADNGLKSITKTVESMQSTLRQARQDKSFKTQSMELDTTAIAAGGTVKTLNFSGGALGSSTSIDLNTLAGTATPTTFAGDAGTFSTNFTGGNITIDGTSVAIRGDVATATANTVTGAAKASFAGADAVLTIDSKTVTLVAATQANGADAATKMQTDLGAGYTVTFNADETFSIVKADGTGVDIAETGAGDAAKLGLTVGTNQGTGGIPVFDATLATVQADVDAALGTGYTIANDGTGITISKADGTAIAISGDATLRAAIGFSGTGSTNGTAGAAAATKTVDQLVTEINGTTGLNTAVRASNDNGKLRIENLSTKELSVEGVGSSGKVDGTTGTSNTAKIGGNDVRKNLEKQFNDLRDQLDKFSDDASFNGINLLRGDKLKLTFNETGTSTIEIQAKDKNNAVTSINNTSLGIDSIVGGNFDSDTTIDTKLDTLKNALDSLRSQASTFGSNLSVVENRQDFTKRMINTLETGAANLTLADTNEEAANLLALQTRQQLSSTALSMASQSDQAVLRLF